jgi:hypothetical protein
MDTLSQITEMLINSPMPTQQATDLMRLIGVYGGEKYNKGVDDGVKVADRYSAPPAEIRSDTRNHIAHESIEGC